MTLLETQINQPMVEVGSVRRKHTATLEKPPQHRKERIEDRDSQSQSRQGKSNQSGGFGCTYYTGGCYCKAQEQTSAIAHEYLCRVEVEEQKAGQTTEQS